MPGFGQTGVLRVSEEGWVVRSNNTGSRIPEELLDSKPGAGAGGGGWGGSQDPGCSVHSRRSAGTWASFHCISKAPGVKSTQASTACLASAQHLGETPAPLDRSAANRSPQQVSVLDSV